MSGSLPDGFADLSAFADRWAAPDAPARDELRSVTTPAERQAFYNAIGPRLDEVLDRLDQTPLELHSKAEITLMQMALAYAHVAQAVEVQGPDEVRHALSRKHLPITRAPADI